MFWIHEATKIKLLRTAFFLLCLLPTCGVLAWGVTLRLPAYRAAHEQAIAAVLGLKVHMTRASTPRPDTLLYESLEISDPENRQLLARLPFVEVQTLGNVCTIRLPHPAEINGARLDAIWKIIHDQSRGTEGWQQLRLDAPNLTLRLQSSPQTLTDLEGRIDRGDQQTRYHLKFKIAQASNPSDQPLELLGTRDRQQAPGAVRWRLLTGENALSTALVTSLWPAAASLGKECTFAGQVLALQEAESWRASFRGEFANVDLERLLAQVSTHRLRGRGRFTFDELLLENGHIERAAGRLAAGPGTIGHSLIQSVRQHWQLETPTEPRPGAAELAYARLSVPFVIDAHGLELIVPSENNGAVLLDDRQQVVLRQTAARSLPPVSLVHALAPASNVHVPASRQATSLLSVLPPMNGEGAKTANSIPQAKNVRVNETAQ